MKVLGIVLNDHHIFKQSHYSYFQNTTLFGGLLISVWDICLVRLDAVCICPSVGFIPTHTDEIAFIVLKQQTFYNLSFNAVARISSSQWLGGRENGIMQIHNTNTFFNFKSFLFTSQNMSKNSVQNCVPGMANILQVCNSIQNMMIILLCCIY